MNVMPERSTLPPLDAHEEAHSQALTAHIGRAIGAAGGWISFESFMELALYAPGLGYYSAGSAKLGRGGDFVTAPEVSDLFSICVAHELATILTQLNGVVLELGAGTGRMAGKILQTLDTLGVLPQRYQILEVSADLRERQRSRLAQLAPKLAQRIEWLDHLPQQRFAGVVLANEVLDALPVRSFVKRHGAVQEVGVMLDPAGALMSVERCADAQLASEVAALDASLEEPLSEGYQSEICSRVTPWIGGIAHKLERGAVLLFDYGLPRAHYYHPERSAGTLRSHFRMRAHDAVLARPGIQDITAWVDFTRVAEAATDAGLEVAGFTTQTAFLLGAGIEQLILQASDDVARARLASEARQLLMPGEMGEVFKAMLLTRAFEAPLGGFALQDLRHLL